MMPLISVFTPTYNRAGKIHRVFNSLSRQTFQDFEWIIVDDGSTDNTKAVIDHFIGQKPGFEIRYYYQPNAGKHIAINKAVSLAKGKWFHIADSDDELEPETLEVFMKTWNELPEKKQATFCGIVACCKDQYGRRISEHMPGNGVYDGNFSDLVYKYKFSKELFMINKTEVMKEFPFPDEIRNCLVPESTVWKRMTSKYPVRFINDEMRIYYIDDGISLQSPGDLVSPQSKALPNCIESSNVINYDLSYFRYRPLRFFKMAFVYHSFFPFLNEDQRKWVLLRPAAKAFAFPFIFAGRIYSWILAARHNKRMRNK